MDQKVSQHSTAAQRGTSVSVPELVSQVTQVHQGPGDGSTSSSSQWSEESSLYTYLDR